jgi:hypothetical protein
MRHRRGCGGGPEIQVPNLAFQFLSYPRQKVRGRIAYPLFPIVHSLVGYAEPRRQSAQSHPPALAQDFERRPLEYATSMCLSPLRQALSRYLQACTDHQSSFTLLMHRKPRCNCCVRCADLTNRRSAAGKRQWQKQAQNSPHPSLNIFHTHNTKVIEINICLCHCQIIRDECAGRKSFIRLGVRRRQTMKRVEGPGPSDGNSPPSSSTWWH